MAVLLLLPAAGCRTDDGGLRSPWTRADPGFGTDASDAPISDAGDGPLDRRPEAPPLISDPPPGIAGPPAVVGCADGTREGFLDVIAWRRIAGCSGSFEVPGLTGPAARTPQCGRRAGNSSMPGPPEGVACSVADLCADGWHVCENAEEVRTSSPTECESAAPEGYLVFFVTRAGATPYGLCLADSFQANDLHGCGNLGQPETSGCQPLDRRLTFIECGHSLAWVCGDQTGHLDEGNLVYKTSPAQGGALCCRDAIPADDSD